MSLVSTIIPVYNRPEFIVEAVQSVLGQTHSDIEIIIVDDGSTDDTPRVLEKLATEHSQVKVLSQVNAGPGAARQKGLDACKGEFVQYLDSDDLLKPTKLELQLTALKSNPQAGVAYGKTRLEFHNGELIAESWKRTGVRVNTMFPTFLEERWWGTSTPLYRKSTLDQVGEWLPISNEEDWEYDCRIAALGGELEYVDDIVSIQRRHKNNISNNGMSLQALIDRANARLAIYQSALKSVVSIPDDSLTLFSKSTFLLARQCAERGLPDQAKQLLKLSVLANPQGATIFHKMFGFIANIFGFKTAALLAKFWQGFKK